MPGARTFIAPIAALLALAPAAAAQTPPSPPANPAQPPPPSQQPPPSQPAPAPAPAPPPAARLTLASDRDGAVLAGRTFRVAGRLTPAAPGERVVVRLYRGKRKVATKSVKVAADGAYRTRLKVARSGSFVIRASHRRSAAVGTAVARGVAVDVLPRRVGAGARGRAVRLLQRHLARRGYLVGRRGLFDAKTARGVLAFRKVTGMRRTSAADRSVMARLARGGGHFRARYPSHGKHIEADLSRQVIVLLRGRRVERIYHTSSGSPATPTVRGKFRFYLAQPGLNGSGMFWSKYFVGEYAIHGYKSVPVYPASHGCLRVPMSDAKSIYDWIDMGDRMDVYA
jgi:hypothetical protein